jgi:uncharacterized protein (TIGR02001 family)
MRLQGLGAALVILLHGAAARAELALSASAESDYRVRGVSFSGGQPTLGLNAAYDHDSGVYASASAIAVATEHDGVRPLGWVAQAGYARRIDVDTSWDIGVTNTDVSLYADRSYRANYTEVYAGVTRGAVSAHVYYSPNYLGRGRGTVYFDVNGAVRPAEHWRLFGHVGVQAPLNAPPHTDTARLDLRAGVAREFKRCEMHVEWTTTTSAPIYPVGYGQSRSALVVGAALFF